MDPPLPGVGRMENEKEVKKDNQGKAAEWSSVKQTDKSTSRTGQHPSQSALSSRNDRRSAKSPQRTDVAKEHKHPFALYGWGEKHTDTGSQKTHNVCASASVHEACSCEMLKIGPVTYVNATYPVVIGHALK
nr:centriole, cilia and spindle-associated protein isoform X2 [Pelodiscus sinensis]|eukprot:XP_025039867.1 centriole, cilia and spindle-associated protein isoform X2 [Pelodiscus sinensis]